MTIVDLGDGQYYTRIDTNFSNPNKWADPDGYAAIENSKGTTILDRKTTLMFFVQMERFMVRGDLHLKLIEIFISEKFVANICQESVL